MEMTADSMAAVVTGEEEVAVRFGIPVEPEPILAQTATSMKGWSRAFENRVRDRNRCRERNGRSGK